MIYRFCKKCAQQMEQSESAKYKVIRLVADGNWVCPYGEEECGTREKAEATA